MTNVRSSIVTAIFDRSCWIFLYWYRAICNTINGIDALRNNQLNLQRRSLSMIFIDSQADDLDIESWETGLFKVAKSNKLALFNKLPSNIQGTAVAYGCSDSVFRDDALEYMCEKLKIDYKSACDENTPILITAKELEQM